MPKGHHNGGSENPRAMLNWADFFGEVIPSPLKSPEKNVPSMN